MSNIDKTQSVYYWMLDFPLFKNDLSSMHSKIIHHLDYYPAITEVY